MTVLEADVKALLDVSASAGLTSATFTANIGRSKRVVDDVADPLADAAQVDDAIAAMAAWLSYGAYTEGISQELGNISIADKTKLNHFRKVAEYFINRISLEPVDLSMNNVGSESLIGLDPSVAGMTTSEQFDQ
jgi:hypothetical protein